MGAIPLPIQLSEEVYDMLYNFKKNCQSYMVFSNRMKFTLEVKLYKNGTLEYSTELERFQILRNGLVKIIKGEWDRIFMYLEEFKYQFQSPRMIVKYGNEGDDDF